MPGAGPGAAGPAGARAFVAVESIAAEASSCVMRRTGGSWLPWRPWKTLEEVAVLTSTTDIKSWGINSLLRGNWFFLEPLMVECFSRCKSLLWVVSEENPHKLVSLLRSNSVLAPFFQTVFISTKHQNITNYTDEYAFEEKLTYQGASCYCIRAYTSM